MSRRAYLARCLDVVEAYLGGRVGSHEFMSLWMELGFDWMEAEIAERQLRENMQKEDHQHEQPGILG